MERKEYFKIIELPTHQVLVEKDYDSEEESDLLVISLFIDGIKMKQSLGFGDDTDKRDKFYDSFDSSHASELLESAQEMLKED